MMKHALIIAAAMLATTSAQAGSKYMSWQGKWSLDTAKTHYPATFPKITKNDMNVTKDDGKILQFTDTLTMDGKDVTQSFDGAYDGKFRPTPDGMQVAYHRASPKTVAGIRKAADGFIVEHSACTFADDGETMTCHIKIHSKTDKKPLEFDEYFNRVKS